MLLLVRYPYFRGSTMVHELTSDVVNIALGTFGVEAMMRVR